MTQDIEGRIKAWVLDELLPGEDPAALTNTTPLVTSGVLDSIAKLRFVAFLDKEFSISVKAHEASNENFETIERITQLVSSKQKR